MKSNKGITLISVVVYLLVMTILMTIFSIISMYFYKNTNTIENTTDNARYLTRLNMYLENDLQDVKNIIVEENKIIITKLNEEITYTYVNTSTDKGIYRNKVKLCSEVMQATFALEPRLDKKVLSIDITIGNTENLTKQLQYTI